MPSAFPRFPELAADAVVLAVAEELARLDPRAAARRTGRPADPRAVARARDLLDGACDSAVTGESLERVSGLSRYELARQFRAAFGTTPHRYLTMRRVDRARGLLQSGASLAQVALGAGFADQSHRTRRFRAVVGMTSGRYRALVSGA